MNVLILGGTSFFGREIARVFSAAGHTVTTFSRVKNSPLEKIPHIEGNRSNKQDLLNANKFGPWDLLIDNIAFGAADVALSLDVFKSVKHYILTSTVSIYRFIPDEAYHPPIKEGDVNFDYLPKDENETENYWIYARGKLEAERVLKKQSQIPWTTIRPPVVYGPNDVTGRGYWYLERLLEGKEILLANDGQNSFQLCYSLELARTYLLAAQNKASLGKAYNVAMTEVLTLRKFVELSAEALGVNPKFVDVGIDEYRESGGPYAKMENRLYDSTLAKKDLGFEHCPLPGFIKETATWFKTRQKTSSFT